MRDLWAVSAACCLFCANPVLLLDLGSCKQQIRMFVFASSMARAANPGPALRYEWLPSSAGVSARYHPEGLAHQHP